MRRDLVCRLACAIAGWMIALPGAADMPTDAISAFNQAVQSGDAGTIVDAAKSLGATAIAHPEDKQAPVAAFEAGNQLCLHGACAEAVPMATFLQGLEGDLSVSRPLVETLAAFSTWSASDKGKTADKAFAAVLEAHAGDEPSLLSIVAFDEYSVDAATSDDWAETQKRAALAARHMEPVRDIIPARWATMDLLAASAEFNATLSIDAMQPVADLETWLYLKRHVDDVEGLDDVYYATSAWVVAMSAYFRSTSTRDSRQADRITKAAEEARSAHEHNDDAEDGDNGPPLCKGQVSVPPRPNYPLSAVTKGYVGAVLVGFDFVDGKPANYRVLAAVPDKAFEKATLDSMKRFRWKWDKEQENPDCTRSSRHPAIYPFEYVIE